MFKKFAHSLTPPIFWIALRRLFALIKGRPTYEPTVYSSVDACPIISDDIWSNSRWLKHVEADGKEALRQPSKELNMHQSSLLIAALASTPLGGQKQVSILDFGGGVGLYFPFLQNTLSFLGVIPRYAVVDSPTSCEVGRRLNKQEGNIQFFNSHERGLNLAHDFLGFIDVCNISSTLHYILNWREALQTVVQLSPRLIIISRAPTPDMASHEGYVIQHIATKYGYCGAARVVLIPAALLIDAMESMGYSLLIEQGWVGDAQWCWEAGCSSTPYQQLTTRSFVFIRRAN